MKKQIRKLEFQRNQTKSLIKEGGIIDEPPKRKILE